MEKKVITEEQVQSVINNILSEQFSKVSRQEFSRVQFKIEELQNSLNDTIRELRKIEDSVPSGLKTLMTGRMTSISNSLGESQRLLIQLKEKIRKYKRSLYSTSTPATNTEI